MDPWDGSTNRMLWWLWVQDTNISRGASICTWLSLSPDTAWLRPQARRSGCAVSTVWHAASLQRSKKCPDDLEDTTEFAQFFFLSTQLCSFCSLCCMLCIWLVYQIFLVSGSSSYVPVCVLATSQAAVTDANILFFMILHTKYCNTFGHLLLCDLTKWQFMNSGSCYHVLFTSSSRL